MNRLYVVRHGESKWNLSNKLQGQKNVSLTLKGISQAMKLSHNLREEQIDYIYSSDLKRAYETAKIIGNVLDKKVYPKKGLRERSFGKWEGLTNLQIKKLYKHKYDLWNKHPQNVKIPKGETFQEVKNRTVKTLNSIINKHRNKNILIVSHSVVVKILIMETLKLDNGFYKKIQIKNCDLNIIDLKNREIISNKFK
ncbi:MAG: histidine phosphatase family protein [Firmicutes bacterium]|nr:histidine phosphatase family protein [Bacillota bacterium]